MSAQEKSDVRIALDLTKFPIKRFHRFLPVNATHTTQLKKGDLIYRPAPLKPSRDYITMHNMLRTKIQVAKRSEWQDGKISNCPFGLVTFTWAKSINRECIATGRESWYILVFPPNSSNIGNFHLTLYDQESTAVSNRLSHATFEQSINKDTSPEQEHAFYSKLQNSIKEYVWSTIRKPGDAETCPGTKSLKSLAIHQYILQKIQSYTTDKLSHPYKEHINDILGLYNQNKAACNHARQIPNMLGLGDKGVTSLAEVKATVKNNYESLIKYTPGDISLLNELLSHLDLIENHIRRMRENRIAPSLTTDISSNATFSGIYQATYDAYPKTRILIWRMFLKSIFPLGNLVCLKRTDPIGESEVVYNSIDEIRANPSVLDIYHQMSDTLRDTVDQIHQSTQQELKTPVVFPPIKKSS